jgi:excisionase family DNA binding protein
MTSSPLAERTLATIPEVARMYGVADRTIRRRVYDGSLRAYKIGKSVRIDLDDAETAFRFSPVHPVGQPNVPRPGLAPRPAATAPERIPTTVAEARAMLAGSPA